MEPPAWGALARELVERGAAVAVIARGAPGLAALRASLPQAATITGHIADKRQTHRIYAEALAALGGIDVLIHNASSLGHVPMRLLLDTDCEELQRVLETNLVGPFRLSKLVLPGMILNRSGIVVAISSDAAVNAYPRWGAYGVSKAALDHLTRIFQEELSGSGVRFLALDPSDMDTPLHRAAVPDADPSQLHRPESSARLIVEQLEREQFTPIRRSIR